jgi:hypothetical protein
MDELKVTRQRVLKAAGSCADAKRVLQELFPEAFADVGFVQFEELDAGAFRAIKAQYLSGLPPVERRNGGIYDGALYLSGSYTWEIVKDDAGLSVLVGKTKS